MPAVRSRAHVLVLRFQHVSYKEACLLYRFFILLLDHKILNPQQMRMPFFLLVGWAVGGDCRRPRRGLRIDPAVELIGLDQVYHGCPAKKKKKAVAEESVPAIEVGFDFKMFPNPFESLPTLMSLMTHSTVSSEVPSTSLTNPIFPVETAVPGILPPQTQSPKILNPKSWAIEVGDILDNTDESSELPGRTLGHLIFSSFIFFWGP